MIGELLLLLRGGVPERGNAKAHRGVWNKLAAGSFEARGKTALSVTAISGTQLGILAESLGMHISMTVKINCRGSATQVQHLSGVARIYESTMWSVCTYLACLHQNMMSKEIALMKPGSLLINAARAYGGGYPGFVRRAGDEGIWRGRRYRRLPRRNRPLIAIRLPFLRCAEFTITDPDAAYRRLDAGRRKENVSDIVAETD